jgi:hypothetical protein
MQREHARSPIDAFLLLGDNFYPSGLLAEELVSRIVENVARPYCAFVDASEELARRLDPSCIDIEGERPSFFAIPGNHDLISPGSEDLQITEVPRFVRNWDMPALKRPAIRELPGGLSLIFLDSGAPWTDADVETLSAAVASAQGPWRVIVGHRPPIAGHPQLRDLVAQAIERSGQTVHAYLAGHVHVLAAIRGEPPQPALTVIAGSGSHAERQESTEYRIEGADLVVEELGFTRLDLVKAKDGNRLRITLFQSPRSITLSDLGNTIVARYEIEADGSVTRTDENASGESP